MIKLRGHHLLCLQFFEGKGYDEQFVENVKKILQRMNKGERVKLVEGKDDICNSCPNWNNGKCMLDEKIEEKDKKVLKIFGFTVGEELLWNRVVQKFSSLSKKDFLNICKGCLWKNICFK